MESSRNVIKVNRDNKSTVRAPLDGVERWIDSRWPRSPLVMGIKQEGRTERSRWRQQVIGCYTGGMLVRLGDATSSRDYNNTGSLSLALSRYHRLYIYIYTMRKFLSSTQCFCPVLSNKRKDKNMPELGRLERSSGKQRIPETKRIKDNTNRIIRNQIWKPGDE